MICWYNFFYRNIFCFIHVCIILSEYYFYTRTAFFVYKDLASNHKKNKVSEFDQLAKIDLWFIVSLLDHSPLTIIHSQNSVLLEKCTLGNQRGQQSVLRARNQCSVFFLHRPFLCDVWDVGRGHGGPMSLFYKEHFYYYE